MKFFPEHVFQCKKWIGWKCLVEYYFSKKEGEEHMYVSLCAYVKIFFNPTNEMEKEKKKLL